MQRTRARREHWARRVKAPVEFEAAAEMRFDQGTKQLKPMTPPGGRDGEREREEESREDEETERDEKEGERREKKEREGVRERRMRRSKDKKQM